MSQLSSEVKSETRSEITIKRFQCRHIHTDGRRCASPSLRGEDFCYFHHTTRRNSRVPHSSAALSRMSGVEQTFTLPLPEDRSAIQLSIGEVLQRIASNSIDPRRAGLLLYGLQIASLNLGKHVTSNTPPIEEFTHDADFGPLAPPTEVVENKGRESTAARILREWHDKKARNTEEKPGPSSGTVPSMQAVAANHKSSEDRVPRGFSLGSHASSRKLTTMAFSLFGKREQDPAQPSENLQPEAKPGLFDRMKQAVTRTRESLAGSLASVVALTREVDDASLDELEFALLAADIGADTTAEIIANLRARALRHGITSGVELKQLLKVELLRILNAVAMPTTHPSAPPEVILLVGVNGTGKTTTSGKLAAMFRREGHSVLLCAADTFRAAAIEQLEVWADRSGVSLIKTKQGGDPSAALYDALAAAKARATDILLVDTAGRLHTKTGLMDELDKMTRTAARQVEGSPHQTLLVIDATTGQNGLQQARLFTEAARVTGIVLTKLDGTAKGGIVVAIAHELGLPVRFVGIGEKLEDLIPFDPDAFVDSLLD
jgi:fused signal recognition particle receptor